MTDSIRPVALITGAGSGIGRATALALAERGYAVALAGRTRKTLAETAQLVADAGGAAAVHPCDLADGKQAARLVEDVAKTMGRLDVLINNAGFASLTSIPESGEEHLREVFAVNTIGPGAAIAAAWPIFKCQKSGCVVNVSTMGTKDPFPGFYSYAASKAALESFTRSCAKEGKAIGVRAFCVAPGATETPMLRSMFSEKQIPASAAMPPETIAEIIAACIAGERDGDNGKVIYAPPG